MCTDAGGNCLGRQSQFCAIENHADVDYDEPAQYVLRGRQNEYAFDEAYLEPAREVGRWGDLVAGISADGQWALIESYRIDGGGFVPQ